MKAKDVKESPVAMRTNRPIINTSTPAPVPTSSLPAGPKVLGNINTIKPENTLESLPQWVREISKDIIQNVDAYTNFLVDNDRLLSEGMDYCKSNNWQIVGQYALIDQVKGNLRYIYNSDNKEYVALSYQQKILLLKRT